MNYTNPLRDNEKYYLREEEGKLFSLSDEIRKISKEEQKISKTNANHVIEMTNGGKLFCHLDKENGFFVIAETVSKDSHDVWLKDMKSVTFYEGNIVLRDNEAQKSEPFQKEEEINKLINQEYDFLNKKEIITKVDNTIKGSEGAVEKVKSLDEIKGLIHSIRDKDKVDKPDFYKKNNK